MHQIHTQTAQHATNQLQARRLSLDAVDAALCNHESPMELYGQPVDVDRLFSLSGTGRLGGVFALDDNRNLTTEIIGAFLPGADGKSVDGVACYKDLSGNDVVLPFGKFDDPEDFFEGLVQWHMLRNQALGFNIAA